MDDYGIELLSPDPAPLEEALAAGLLAPTGLAEDIPASLNAAEMAKRRFRDIARVAGLLFQGPPGQRKPARHLQASSGLFYEVFAKYDPGNLLLHQAHREVLEQQLERSRLGRALARLAESRVTVLEIARPSPMAFPLMVARMREKLSSESLADRVRRMQARLEKAASTVIRVDLQGESLLLLPERALLWERTGTLGSSDAHLGKAAAFRAAAIPLPGGTTTEALSRLSTALARTGARRLLLLGDFFHARAGRAARTLAAIAAWRERHADLEVVLVRGNHDKGAGDPPSEWGFDCQDEPRIEPPFAFRHHPEEENSALCAGGAHPSRGLPLGIRRVAREAPLFPLRGADRPPPRLRRLHRRRHGTASVGGPGVRGGGGGGRLHLQGR